MGLSEDTICSQFSLYSTYTDNDDLGRVAVRRNAMFPVIMLCSCYKVAESKKVLKMSLLFPVAESVQSDLRCSFKILNTFK